MRINIGWQRLKKASEKSLDAFLNCLESFLL